MIYECQVCFARKLWASRFERGKKMILCRKCEHWYSTAQWQGNCKIHPFWKDQWSQTAEPNFECKGEDFIDKYAKYRVEVKNG